MAVSEPQQLDLARVEAFGERMVGLLNGAGLMLTTSIGHRTGLFDAMAEMPPATSLEIAERTGLNERYVREWLGAMVTGRIVEFDPGNQTYFLPREHAAMLTRAAVPNNIAQVAQFVAVLGSVEDEIVDCFRNGGGVDYCCFERFHPVMAEESAQTVVACLFDSILPLAPELIERLERGIEVLDVGCGSARALNAMAERFPNSRFTGYDLSTEAISAGQAQAELRGLTNVTLEVQDVTRLGAPERFDLITAFDAIHDQAQPDKVLSEINAALKPDGIFLMQDIDTSSRLENNIDNPLGAFIYTISTMHCMTVSLAQGGAGLGTAWGVERAQAMLREAGFNSIQIERLPHDIMNAYFIVRK